MNLMIICDIESITGRLSPTDISAIATSENSVIAFLLEAEGDTK